MTYQLQPHPDDSKEPEENAAPTAVGSERTEKSSRKKPLGRLTSLDAFRGFIMMMLAANGFGIYQLSRTDAASDLWQLLDQERFQQLAFHFQHPDWQSNFIPGEVSATVGNAWLKWKVSFWDLIQPSFMFMVGLAMPFSYLRRESTGQSKLKRTAHALIRAIVLVLLGVFLYSRREQSTNWIFTNVLAQIGLGYFFVYLLLGTPRWAQITAFCVILVGTTVGLQVAPPVGEYIPEEVNASYEKGEILSEPYARWSKNGNAFHDFDVWFLNVLPRPEQEDPADVPHRFNRGGYTTLNFVPSMATILLGVFIGQFILISARNYKTFGYLLLAAIGCTALGVFFGATCCPIIKKIWTPSWVLFSGGYVIGLFALFYLLFDLWPLKKLAFPLVVIGMNSIFVYMMGQLLRPWIYKEIVMKHFDWLIEKIFAIVKSVSGSDYSVEQLVEMFEPVVMSTSVFLVIWLLCYWMYRQKIFIRI